MPCCQCQGIETLFNEKLVAKQLKRYHKKGADKTTRILINALKQQGVEGMTLLDIGGGFGAIQHVLLKTGINSAESVEAATAYLEAAREEAKRRALDGRIRFHHGDFVELAGEIRPADIVTLDRVICCYHDMPAQVTLSLERSRKFYGLVYPRDTWFMKAVIKIQNFIFRMRGSPFRLFTHSTPAVDDLVRGKGFAQCFYKNTFAWQVVVYSRADGVVD